MFFDNLLAERPNHEDFVLATLHAFSPSFSLTSDANYCSLTNWFISIGIFIHARVTRLSDVLRTLSVDVLFRFRFRTLTLNHISMLLFSVSLRLRSKLRLVFLLFPFSVTAGAVYARVLDEVVRYQEPYNY